MSLKLDITFGMWIIMQTLECVYKSQCCNVNVELESMIVFEEEITNNDSIILRLQCSWVSLNIPI